MKTRLNFCEAKSLICPMCGMICKATPTEASDMEIYCPDCELEYIIVLTGWKVIE